MPNRYVVMPLAASQWHEDRVKAVMEAEQFAALNPGSTYYICKVEESVFTTTKLVHTLMVKEEEI